MFILLVSINVKAQENSDTLVYHTETVYNNIIKADIFSPLAGMIAFAYERSFNNTLSGQIEVRGSANGIILTPELRVYLSILNAPQGVFVAPWIRIGKGISLFQRDSNFGGGICVGVQTVKKRIAISAFIGPAIYAGSGKRSATVLRGGVFLGYAF